MATVGANGEVIYDLNATTQNLINNAANNNLSNLTNAGNTVISGIADKSVKVVQGTNTTVKSNTVANSDGTSTTTYTVNADKSTTSVSSALDMTSTTTADSDGVKTTDYALDLSATTKDNIQKGVDAKDIVDTQGLTFTGDSGTTGVKKLGDTVAVVGGSNITTTATTSGVQVELNKDIDLGSTGSITTGNTVINTDGLTNGNTTLNGNGLSITGGPSVTTSGIDAGNQVISNVATPVNSTDAVNKSYVDDGRTKVTSNNNSVTVNHNTATNTYDLAIDTSNIANTTNLTYKANGTNAQTTTLANGLDFKDGTSTVATVGANGEVRYDLKDRVSLGTDPTKQIVLDSTTGKISVGDKVTIDGTTGDSKFGKVSINGEAGTITGLTNTEWDVENPVAESGRAATEDQLKKVNDGLNTKISNLDDKITNTSNELINKGLNFGANSGGTVTNKLGSEVKIVGTGTKEDEKYSSSNIKTKVSQAADGKTTIEVMLDKELTADKLKVGKEGTDGVDGSIAVDGKDGSGVIINGKDGSIGLKGTNGTNALTIKGENGTDGVDGANGAAGKTRIVYERENPDGTKAKEEVATLNDGMKYGGDTGNAIKKKLNEQVSIVGGIKDEEKLSKSPNVGVISDGANNLTIRLAKDLKDLSTITLVDESGNKTTINNSGMTISTTTADGTTKTVSLTENGLNNGGNKITNVASGEDETDAVNVSQLNEVKNVVNNHADAIINNAKKIDKLDSEMRHGFANAAAMATLKYMEIGVNQVTVGAALGTYKGTQAVAVGVQGAPTEDTRVHAQVSVSPGRNSTETMAGIGAAWRFNVK